MLFRPYRSLKKATREQEEEFAKQLAEEKVGLKDKLAMLLAAFLTLFLPCVLILCGLALLVLWLFGAL